MKQQMKFNLYGNTLAVYYQEETETYLIYQLVGKKKIFLDYEDGLMPAATHCINWCYEHMYEGRCS